MTTTNLTSVAYGLMFCVVFALILFMGVGSARAETLDRELQFGMSGGDVSALQTFLANDPSLYPQGLVTGYFGSLTKAAVANFQARNGIAAVGRVGPVTLPVLNLQMSGNLSDNAGAPVITNVKVNPSRNSAIVSWNTNEAAKGVVHFSPSPLTTYENSNSVNVSGNTTMTDTNLRSVQNVLVQGLATSTTYHYLVYVTDQAGNVSVTWPSTFQTTN